MASKKNRTSLLIFIFFLFFLVCLLPLFVLFYSKEDAAAIILVTSSSSSSSSSSCPPSSLYNNPYVPPTRHVQGIHSIRTQRSDDRYSQVGILSRKGGEILPFMGRRIITTRNKWHYYTMSGGANNLQTKLPIKVGGKTCSNEYGCDEVYTGDEVFVEGFREMFDVTIYESGEFFP